ncbi:MAG: NmrA family NAD(P)-binding protein [Chitinophagaceae bacterium]
MKIIVTGSLGNISKPLTQSLVQQGHEVTVISSKADKQNDIEAIGAIAAIGSIDDVNFLTETFTGADAVYCMIPPNFAVANQVDYYSKVGSNYAKAIAQSGVKRVVDLSSYGAHLGKGTGFIVGSYHVEQILNALSNVSVTHIRPGYFYYNFLHLIGMIQTHGFIASNFGDDDKLAMASPVDIAEAIAAEIVKPASEKKVRYVVSDDKTCNEISSILGKAIGNADLQWKTFTNEQVQTAMEARGMSAATAATMVELGDATHKGLLREDYDLQKPTEMGKVKIEDFTKEFAIAFNK